MCSVQGLKYTAPLLGRTEPTQVCRIWKDVKKLGYNPDRVPSGNTGWRLVGTRRLADAPPLGSAKKRRRVDKNPEESKGHRVVTFGRHTEGGVRVLANNSAEGAGVEGMSVLLDCVWYLTEAHAVEAHKFDAAASVSAGLRREALLEYSSMFKGLNPKVGDNICVVKARGREFLISGLELDVALRSSVSVQARICMFKLSHSRLVRETLASTGTDTLLMEDTNWKSYWGGYVAQDGRIRGANNLGKIWMKLRETIV